MTKAIDGPVILFDGVCNLCNGAVQFIIQRDQNRRFRFASLQSTYASTLLQRFGRSADMHSILVVENGIVFEKSEAALKIASKLNAPWRYAMFLRFIPRSIRDLVYDLIARSRYRIFGKRDECMIPSPEQMDRFLG